MTGTLTTRAEAVRRALQLDRGRLRASSLRLRGARLGRKVVVGRGCRIDRPFCLIAGDRVTFEDRVFLKIVSDDAMVEMGQRVFVGRGVELDVHPGGIDWNSKLSR